MRLRFVPLGIVVTFSLLVIAIALTATVRSFAASPAIPAWLQAHVGDSDGQISTVVLERARALYLKKVAQGAVTNPCYFAMDATRPGDLGNGVLGRRYYVVCEASQSFRAISSGHGRLSPEPAGGTGRTALAHRQRRQRGDRAWRIAGRARCPVCTWSRARTCRSLVDRFRQRTGDLQNGRRLPRCFRTAHRRSGSRLLTFQ